MPDIIGMSETQARAKLVRDDLENNCQCWSRGGPGRRTGAAGKQDIRRANYRRDRMVRGAPFSWAPLWRTCKGGWSPCKQGVYARAVLLRRQGPD